MLYIKKCLICGVNVTGCIRIENSKTDKVKCLKCGLGVEDKEAK